MTIEQTLERIANALETIAFYKTAADQQATPPAAVNDAPATAPAEAPSPAAEPAVATEVVRKRGRPRKDEVKREELLERPVDSDPPAPEEPAAQPEEPAAQPEEPAAETPADVKPEDVQKLILELVSKVGRGPVAAVLAGEPFKAARFGTIDTKHHGLLYAKLLELNAVDPMSL